MTGALVVVAIAGVGCAKKDGEEGKTSASASAAESAAPDASGAPAEPAADASAAKADPDACPEGNKPPEFNYADVKFTWSETPSLADAPKDKVYANVGGKTFELPKVELWVSESRGDISLRMTDGVLLGPSITWDGTPKAGLLLDEKFGKNKGHFQVPKKGDTAECARQTTSSNSPNARIVKITKYDGKTADGTFVSTWQEGFGEKRKFWAAGTFKDAKVVIFKK